MTHTTLVPVDTLQQHLGDPAWIVLDVRHDLFKPTAGIEAYRAGHIPGARFAALDDDLSAPKNGRNPAEKITAPPIPALPHASTNPGTSWAGVAMTAQSMDSPMLATSLKHSRPRTVFLLGFTGNIFLM